MAKKIIHIYGASGSGTTTLAKYISEKQCCAEIPICVVKQNMMSGKNG